MVTEYTLVDETNRRIYDLSKGPWYELEPGYDLEPLASSRTRSAFEAGICAVCRKHWPGDGAKSLARLAAEIADFYERAAWKVRVLNDGNHLDEEIAMRGKGYEIAGTAIGGPARWEFLQRYWGGTLVR